MSLHAMAIVATLEMLAATMNRTYQTKMSNAHALALFPFPKALFLVVISLFVPFLVVLFPFFPSLVALSRVAHVHAHAVHVHAVHVHVALALVARVHVHVAHVHAVPVHVARVRFPVPSLASDVLFRVPPHAIDNPAATDLVDLANITTMVRRTYATGNRNIDAVECGEHQSFGTLISDREVRHTAMRSD